MKKDTNELKKYSILFINDSIESSINYIQYFSKYFRNFYLTTNKVNIIEAYDRYQPNIIIMDINFTKTNELENIQKLKTLNSKLKIIIFTAYSEESFLNKLEEYDNTKYLLKPATRKELKEVLELITL